jgi:hypothetical protein
MCRFEARGEADCFRMTVSQFSCLRLFHLAIDDDLLEGFFETWLEIGEAGPLEATGGVATTPVLPFIFSKAADSFNIAC